MHKSLKELNHITWQIYNSYAYISKVWRYSYTFKDSWGEIEYSIYSR